jgi:hypothetical protein
MTLLAFLLKQSGTRELLVEAHNFVYAGLVLLLLAAMQRLFGRKNPQSRSYCLWVLVGAGACLVLLGIWVGEERGPFMELTR